MTKKGSSILLWRLGLIAWAACALAGTALTVYLGLLVLRLIGCEA